MINRYSLTAIGLMIIVIVSYVVQFSVNLGYGISEKTSDWVNFSDYVGGLITPLLSFISLLLLIQSLNLQNNTNNELRAEVKLNQQNEKMRSFETYFFGLIDSQRGSFSNFKLTFPVYFGGRKLSGVSAIQELEDLIETFRSRKWRVSYITKSINRIDNDEHIFNTIRIFFNIVKMITERLSNDNGFNTDERKTQFLTLINFTEFSQLRLVMICMQFMDWESSSYLKNNKEFMSVLETVGGGDNLY